MARSPQPSPTASRFLPLVAAAVAALAIVAALQLTADPDLWGHVRFGADILRSGSLPTHDPYSFTSDIPWVNHEWLAEAAMAAAWNTAGATGLAALKALLVAAAFYVTWLAARRAGASVGAAWLATGVAVFSSLNRTGTFRPQVFALCCCALLCFALRRAVAWGPGRVAAVIAAVVAAWANAHGSWFIGVLIVWLWSTGTWLSADRSAHRAAYLLPPVALVASLATPYGAANWAFLADTVRISRPDVADWVPAWHEPGLFIVWAVPAVAAVYAAVHGRGRRDLLPWLLPTAALGLGALRLARVDLLFGCVAAGLLAQSLASAEARDETGRRQPDAQARIRALIAVGVALVILAPTSRTLVGGFTCIPIDDGFAEGAAIERLAAEPAGARLLTYFDYGEYAIWHLAPRQRVSMDGRRETVYSAATIAEHAAFYQDPVEHSAYPARLGADFVWVPTEAAFDRALRPLGWGPVFQGRVSTVWGRTPVVSTVSRDAALPRCFPGP